MTTIFLNLLAIGTIITGIFSITSKNPVISVIFLISTFVQSAGYLIFIGIQFIALSYIVIYVGAIAVLFLFVIMMINIKLTDILDSGNQYTKNLPLAIVISSLFVYMLFNVLTYNIYNIFSLDYILEKLYLFNQNYNGLNNNMQHFILVLESCYDHYQLLFNYYDMIISNYSQIILCNLNNIIDL